MTKPAISSSDGGPAFPGTTSPTAAEVLTLRNELGMGVYDAKEILKHSGGMSLRDWFAGQALSALVDVQVMGRHTEGVSEAMRDMALVAYGLADAMLAERAKEPS